MPMLGWKLVYSLQNNEIIFANSEILLESMLLNNTSQEKQTSDKFDEFTTVRFNLHDQAFDSIMREIRKEELKNEENESLDFFVDNVGSLFDVLSNVNRVEIRKSSSNNYLSEELEYILE